jgi:hypothetical protein
MKKMKVMGAAWHHAQIGQAMQGGQGDRKMVCDDAYTFNIGFTILKLRAKTVEVYCCLFFARSWPQSTKEKRSW